MASEIIINTARTLSVNSIPGEDIRIPTTNSDSIFTFGSFRLEQSSVGDTLDNKQKGGGFSNFSTLESLGSEKFDASKILSTTVNELNPKKDDPLSYSYFGSFYTKIAVAINNIIENFPYAITSYDYGTGTTLYDYTERVFYNDSTFKIPLSALTNQGNVIFVSGATQTGFTTDVDQITLFDDYDKFAIQLSGANTTHQITNYSYSAGTGGYLTFTAEGLVLTGSQISTTTSIFIRPTLQRYGEYKKTISNLEYQLLFGGTFLVPDEDGETFTNQSFIWPKTIDGFNPDISGTNYEDFEEEILYAAQSVDETKTNIMLRTMIPENYLDLDTDSQIYRKILSVFSTEFDTIKQYIDSLAFSYTVDYSGEENIPNKFIQRLSRLLGLDLFNAFNDVDFFEYLGGNDATDTKSYEEYNLELWRKILSNINWLYKKKGTRDSLMFIFKLIGAPDSLIEFNEFTYKVNRVIKDETELQTPLSGESKINEYGYINYDASNFAFQEGGEGRGNGQAYINQWKPEFDLERIVDNVKVHTGDTSVYGTQDKLNTKEIQINLNPSFCVENDVKEWYEIGTGWWEWGSGHIPFSASTVPYWWQVEDIQTVASGPYNTGSTIFPSYITGMSISQWIDYIYASNVNPRNRKTEHYGEVGHTYIYLNLKRIYMTYMLWTNDEESNRLTIGKLEHFLNLLERSFANYIPQLLPATTILDAYGTKYRNPDFVRQRFVYPPGINDGSTFQRRLPDNFNPIINAVVISNTVNSVINPSINSVVISTSKSPTIEQTINSIMVNQSIDTGIALNVNATKTAMDFYSGVEKIYYHKTEKFNGTPKPFSTD